MTPEGRFPKAAEAFVDVCLLTDPEVRKIPKELLVVAPVVLQALKWVVVPLHPLELPVSSFSPSHFHTVAGRELLRTALFFLRPSPPRIGH